MKKKDRIKLKAKQEKARNKALGKGGYNKFLVDNARRMKREPTATEKLFRQILIEKKIPFREQVPFQDKEGHKYIIDFLLGDRYIIEIDGGYHMTTDQIERDRIRDGVMLNSGFKVKRYTNEEVNEYTKGLNCWLNSIRGVINQINTFKNKK